MRITRLLAPALLAALFATRAALAVEPHEMLDDPALEARARALSAGLRCVVCRNQSIDDSNAEIAADLRILLRERIAAGDSDEQAVAYLVDRYGSYILLKPPVTGTTWALWFGPFVLLALAGLGFSTLFRRRAAAADANDIELSDEDRALIARVLRDEETT